MCATCQEKKKRYRRHWQTKERGLDLLYLFVAIKYRWVVHVFVRARLAKKRCHRYRQTKDSALDRLYQYIAITDRCGVHGARPRPLTVLKDASDNGHDMILRTSLPPLILHLQDASAPLLLRDTYATDIALSISHTRVDINVFRSDEERAVRWPDEPAVDLPTQE